MSSVDQSGTFALGDLHVRPLGFGAMQLSGPNVSGPPKDRTVALSVLREAVVVVGTSSRERDSRYAPPA
jgi:pyridoxine 4-dehydrogenase